MTRLSRERWEQLDALLAAAIDRSPEAREALLRDAAAVDPELESAVRELLQIHADADDALGESVTDLVPLLMSSADEELGGDANESLPVGGVVGPYRIVEEIGRGGMGSVYLAERADDQFEKRVALKVVKRGMDTDEVLRRFRHERQILASLEHPNVARLLDGGVTADGRPYLVMEHIDGQPVDSYCDERRLTVDQRLNLFAAVCQAVQYAHRNLVVHRDLKPSNILVSAAGEPKLLDFGIARLLTGSDDDAPLTRTGGRILTPEFASPEQITGAPITTASDVFGLGVVLYLLLTGRLPFRRPQSSRAEVDRSVLEDDPERPSVAVLRAQVRDTAASPELAAGVRGETPARLSRRLRGDLDTMILKALEKDPARRYASVDQLLDDLQRHRQGRPLIAQPGTVRTRAMKFARRHRFGVGAAVAFALLGTVSAVAFMSEHRQTVQERNRAERERDKAEEVAAFVEQLFAASSPFAPVPGPMDTVPVRVFLDRGALQVQRELNDRPLVQAQMLDVVGRVYHSLGLYDDAKPLLERALSQRRATEGSTRGDVAESLTSNGLLLVQTGQYDQAQQLLEEALALRRADLGSRHPDVAESLNNLGVLLRERGFYDEAERRQREALRILRNEPGDVRSLLAEVAGGLASTLEFKGEYAAATELQREVLGLRRAVYGDRHPYVAVALQELGLLLQRQGQYDSAEAPIREAVDISERTLGPEHPMVADALNRLASILWWKGALDAAEPIQRRSLALKRRIYGDRHVQVSIGLGNLASLLSDRGDHAEAIALNREALAIVLETLGAEHPDAAIVTGGLATSLQARGDCPAAEPLFREAIEGMRRMLPANHLRIPMLQRRLGNCLTSMGRYSEAEETLVESFRVLRETRGAHDPFAREVAGYLAELYMAWGRDDRAAEYQALAARAEG
jgi:serine/threonine protein kinase